MAAEIDWFAKTDAKFGIGSYREVYNQPHYNYLRAKVHFNQEKIRTLSKEFLPFVCIDYYTQDKIKSYLNNPETLIFEMINDWVLIKPLRYHQNPKPEEEDLKLNYAQLRVLYQEIFDKYRRDNDDLERKIRKLKSKTDAISMKLAQKLRNEFFIVKFIPDGAAENVERLLTVTEATSESKDTAELFIVDNDVSFDYSHCQSLKTRKTVFYPRSYRWNQNVHLPEFNLPNEFETTLVCCQFDPIVYSPESFQEFCSLYGLTTLAADWFFGLNIAVDKFYWERFAEAIDRFQKNELNDIQLVSKLEEFVKFHHVINYRRGGILKAIEDSNK